MSSKLTKEGYETINNSIDNAVALRPIEEMTIQEIKEELNYLRVQIKKKNTLYGYDVDHLIGISHALMRDDITVKDLKESITMYKKGWNEAMKQQKDVIKGIFNKEENK